jgi:predicted transcriptional regulator
MYLPCRMQGEALIYLRFTIIKLLRKEVLAMSLQPSFNKLTGSQRQCAEILATNDIDKKTIAEIAEEVGVTPRTIYRWKQDPVFIAYQNSIAERVMDDFLSETYAQLRTLLRSGRSERTKLEAIRMVLQNRGKLNEGSNVNVQVNNNSNESQEERERRIIEMEQELLNDDNE